MDIITPPSISALFEAVEEFLEWRDKHGRLGPLSNDLEVWTRELTMEFYADRFAQLERLLSDEFTLAAPDLTVEQLTYRLRTVLAGNASEITA